MNDWNTDNDRFLVDEPDDSTLWADGLNSFQAAVLEGSLDILMGKLSPINDIVQVIDEVSERLDVTNPVQARLLDALDDLWYDYQHPMEGEHP